jgi:hypothetical protein
LEGVATSEKAGWASGATAMGAVHGSWVLGSRGRLRDGAVLAATASEGNCRKETTSCSNHKPCTGLLRVHPHHSPAWGSHARTHARARRLACPPIYCLAQARPVWLAPLTFEIVYSISSKIVSGSWRRFTELDYFSKLDIAHGDYESHGGSSTAPTRAREGHVSLFTVVRRQSNTQELLGVTSREVAQLTIAARWWRLWYKQGILYKGACEALAALVSRREGAPAGASGVAKGCAFLMLQGLE